jgi:hypothetical protein
MSQPMPKWGRTHPAGGKVSDHGRFFLQRRCGSGEVSRNMQDLATEVARGSVPANIDLVYGKNFSTRPHVAETPLGHSS